MAWTSPRTWSTGELVTASIMNTHVRDNLNALKTPPKGKVTLTGNVSTTSTSEVDLTGATTTFTTAGGAVMVFFTCTLSVAQGPVDESAQMYINIDGVDVFSQRVRLASGGSVADYKPCTMTFASASLSAGSHTVKIRWKSIGGAQVTVAAATANAHLAAVEAWF
jgi:hypothetical protein